MTGLEPPPPPRVCARVGWCGGKDTGFEVCSAGFICQACSIQAIWKVSGSSFETRGKEDLVYMNLEGSFWRGSGQWSMAGNPGLFKVVWRQEAQPGQKVGQCGDVR